MNSSTVSHFFYLVRVQSQHDGTSSSSFQTIIQFTNNKTDLLQKKQASIEKPFVKLQLNKQTSANLRKSQLKYQSLYRYTSANNYVSQYYC